MADLTISISSQVALDAAGQAAHGGRTQHVQLVGTGVPSSGVLLSGTDSFGSWALPVFTDGSGNWTAGFYLFDFEPVFVSQNNQLAALVVPPVVGTIAATGHLPEEPVPAAVALDEFLQLIQPQHRNRDRFVASVSAALQPVVDDINLLADLPRRYDLDVARGVQLDAVGLWAGVGRVIKVPIANVYFAWDTPNVGWDFGKWRGAADGTSLAVTLNDATYRLLIRARIAANHWDGTLAGAADAYGYIFADPNTHVFIQDNQDHTFSLNISGRPLDQLQMAMLTGGYLPLRPAGVTLKSVTTVSIGGSPLFGWDDNTALVSGWDGGAWGVSS